MTLQEIKDAVDKGLTVHWATDAYIVIPSGYGSYLIKCILNDHCIGLTWRDGITMNGREDQFYLEGGFTDEC